VALKIPINIPVNPVPLAVGLVVVVFAIGGVFYMQRGAHVELNGSILKIRTQAMDENSSVAVVDFRFVNPSDYNFVVREVGVAIEDKDGKPVDGATVSELDARRLFEYYPQLGQKFNDSLLMKSKIPPHQTLDRMIVARFELPESALESRRSLIVRVVDVDGPTSELREKK